MKIYAIISSNMQWGAKLKFKFQIKIHQINIQSILSQTQSKWKNEQNKSQRKETKQKRNHV